MKIVLFVFTILTFQYSFANEQGSCEVKIERLNNVKNSFLVRKSYATLKSECTVELNSFVKKSFDEKSQIFESCFKKVSDKVLAQVQSIKTQNDLNKILKDSLASRSVGYQNYLKSLFKNKSNKISDSNLRQLVKTYFHMGSEIQTFKSPSTMTNSSSQVRFEDIQQYFGASQYSEKKAHQRDLVFFYSKDLLYNGQIKSISQNDYDAEILNVITAQKKLDMSDYEFFGGSQLSVKTTNEDFPSEAVYGSDFVILKNKEKGFLKLYEVSAPTDGNTRRVRQEKDILPGKELKANFTRKYKKGSFVTKFKLQILCK